MTKTREKKKMTGKEIVIDWIKSLVIAFILAMFIRTFFVQAFKIPSTSMVPTLQVGDRLLANKLIYRIREPKRGEVIIFRYPEDRKRDFVKRLVGLPNERISIKAGKIIINGRAVEDPLINPRYYFNDERSYYGQPGQETVIPPNSYFMLGDNSINSKDSRYWGFVPRKDILGKAMFIYWPPGRIRAVK